MSPSPENRLTFFLAQIQGDALLVPVEAVIEDAVVLGEEVGTYAPRDVAAVVGVLDLDHLRALVGEE